MTTAPTIDQAGLTMTLHVRHLKAAISAAPADAWLLRGRDPHTWLAELARWGRPLQSIRLLPLPTSASDRTVSGVLAVPEDSAGVQASPSAQPYRRAAERLYIPADAQLHPPLSPDEVRRLAPWRAALLHPTVGLVAFDEGDVIAAVDLITIAPPSASGWYDAEPAVFSEPHIRAVRPLIVPTLDDVFEAARGDIGTEPAAELPPTDDESVLNQLGRRSKLAGLKALQKFLPQPSSQSGKGIVGKLSSWAHGRSKALAEQLAAARQRELSRLMKLLEKDPDNGLRFALPMRQFESGRGTAEGARLPPRSTSFDLGRFFGSRPTVAWETPWEAQQRLLTKYRELAAREMALGRHRRAAYIYAELLGDIRNAARALEEGRCYRDAAVLYRKKLDDELAAALCLERGGLLQEAAELFDSLSQFEKAADLYRRLGIEAEAIRLYDAAFNALVQRGKLLAGAALLEQKLGAPDRALELLTYAWNVASHEAQPCLREQFRLLARLGRHAEAERRIRTFRAAAEKETRPTQLASVLVDVANDNATREVRTLASDAARVVAGYGLSNAAVALEHASLLHIVARTNVDDRLLSRDAARYNESKQKGSLPRPPSPPKRDPPRPKVTVALAPTQMRMPAGIEWQALAPADQGLIVVGTRSAQSGPLCIVRGTWRLEQQVVESSEGFAKTPLRFAGSAHQSVIAPLGTTRRPGMETLDAIGNCGAMTINPPGILPNGEILGIATDDQGHYHVLYRPAEGRPRSAVALDRIAPDGRLMANLAPTFPVPDDVDLHSVWMIAHGEHVVITIGDQLHWLTRGIMQTSMALPDTVVGMSASPRLTALRLVMSLKNGGCAIVWPQHGELRTFAKPLGPAIPVLLGDGRLLAIAEDRVSVYTLKGRTLEHVDDVPSLQRDAPTHAIRAGQPNQIALVYPNGLLALATVV